MFVLCKWLLLRSHCLAISPDYYELVDHTSLLCSFSDGFIIIFIFGDEIEMRNRGIFISNYLNWFLLVGFYTSTTVAFVPGRKTNHINVVINGYRFTKDYSRNKNAFFKCTCFHRGCKARIKVEEHYNLISPTPSHNHQCMEKKKTNFRKNPHSCSWSHKWEERWRKLQYGIFSFNQSRNLERSRQAFWIASWLVTLLQ